MPVGPWLKKLVRYLPYVYIAGYETGLYLSGDVIDIAPSVWGYRCSTVIGRGATNDKMLTSIDLQNWTGGGIDGTWTTGDFTAAESALNTFWSGLTPMMPPTMTVEQFRWYPFGPDIGPPNPARRITAVSLVGSGTNFQAHQMAFSVTEKVSDPNHWGRMYLPLCALSSSSLTNAGTFSNTVVDTVATVAKGLYTDLSASDMLPVVWSPAKPERPKKGGGVLPATSAACYSVESIQVDNVPDVIRSRRPNTSYRKRWP